MDKFQKQLSDSLKKLGRTPAQIAKSLQRKKIKGDAGSPNHCPLANYIVKEFGVNEATVSCNEVTANGVSIYSTATVEKFVDAFDRGKFPKLEA